MVGTQCHLVEGIVSVAPPVVGMVSVAPLGVGKVVVWSLLYW